MLILLDLDTLITPRQLLQLLLSLLTNCPFKGFVTISVSGQKISSIIAVCFLKKRPIFFFQCSLRASCFKSLDKSVLILIKPWRDCTDWNWWQCQGYIDILSLVTVTAIKCKDIMSHDMTKPTKWVCAQQRLRSAWASAQSDQSLHCPHEESLGP